MYKQFYGTPRARKTLGGGNVFHTILLCVIIMVMSSNHTYSQLWQELAPNQPPNCPPMHNYVFNRAFYEGKVGIGGLVPGSDTAFCQRVYEPQSLLHLHTIYRQEPLQYLPANMTFQSHVPSMLANERSRFAASEIKFLSGSRQNLSSEWEVGAISTIACGRGINPSDTNPSLALYEPSLNTDYRGGLLFFNSQPKGSVGLVEVMRMVNNRVGIGLNTPQGTSPMQLSPYANPLGRFQVISQIIAGGASGENTSRPDFQGIVTLLPGNNGSWWHLKNDNSTLRIMKGGLAPNQDSDVPPPNPYKHTAMTFQNWNNAVTIGSDIIPLNATCAIYTEPFDPNFIQPIALRVARKRTNTTPPISGITGDKNYTLISAGHEDDETFVVKGNGKVEIGNGTGTSGRRIPVTPDTDYLLSVDGKIVAREIVVTANSQWADYVFDEEYSLMPLDSLQTYLKEHKHLPDIPTTQQVEQKGINLGDMQTLLLKKVEELTRYIIELHEKNNTLQQQIHTLQQQNSETQP